MKTIEVIKPTNKFYNVATNEVINKKRVAAYARVSTDEDDQLNSFKFQIEEYTKRIQANKDWEFIGMFSDQGLSGTQMKKRPEFMKMIELARRKEIDLILVKSISRFARNTVDILSLVRELRDLGCIIYFEKENIYSSDPQIDFTLAILSSIAQEESRSISTNVKWSVEKRFKAGKMHISRIYGFEKSEQGELVINEDEAKTVRLIYSLFLQGFNINDIRKVLNERKIPTLNNKEWLYNGVKTILTNEKYCGDAILQKTVTTDYLTHKQVKNDNLATKYFVRNNHEGIVSKAAFEMVKSIFEESTKSSRNLVTKYPLTNIVYCSKCHGNLRRHLVNYRRPSEKVVLDCKHNRMDKSIKCNEPWVDSDLILETAMESIKHLLSSDDVVNSLMNELSNVSCSEELSELLLKKKQELTRLVHQKNTDANLLPESFLNQERILKKEINTLKKEITSSIKNVSLVEIMKNHSADIITKDSQYLIKNIYSLIIMDVDKIICVISKITSTEELICKIDELVKMDSSVRGFYKDYSREKTFGYKVVVHE